MSVKRNSGSAVLPGALEMCKHLNNACERALTLKSFVSIYSIDGILIQILRPRMFKSDLYLQSNSHAEIIQPRENQAMTSPLSNFLR